MQQVRFLARCVGKHVLRSETRERRLVRNNTERVLLRTYFPGATRQEVQVELDTIRR